MAKLAAWLLGLLLAFPAQAQHASVSAPDPFVLGQVLEQGTGLWQGNATFCDTSAKTYRFNAINTGVKTLVLILAGQSNIAAEAPTAYSVTNPTVVDNFSVCDGGMYLYSDPPLGATWAYLALGGSPPTPNPGSAGGNIADLIINRGTFARVIVVPVAVGGTSIANWSTGPLAGNICVAMKRLASRGITPSVTNVTFAADWVQGESDHGTATVTYTAGLNAIATAMNACGFVGRFFINEQTWNTTVDTNVEAAQTGIAGTTVGNVTFVAGANADALVGNVCVGSTACRLTGAGVPHFTDTGRASLATAMEAAMHASGAPF